MARVWVLIETYWNVNNDYGYETREERPVLIETYWNVNFECTQDYQVVTKY